MDAVSYSLASKQAQRIEKFIENPDSTSGIVTVPKTIASGDIVTVPAGRVAVLPNVQIDGVLNVEGEVFIPSGATLGDLDAQLALKAPLVSPAFTNPTATTQAAQDNSTKVATTAYVDGKMVLGTAINSTSGTSIDFTGIPSWVKKITVMFSMVSTNGVSPYLIQIGSTSIVASGYSSSSATAGGSNSVIGINATTGFASFNNAAANLYSGTYTISRVSNNTWLLSGSIANISSNYIVTSSGASPNLAASLDRIRITTVNGIDIFDGGQINIMYEG